MDSKKPWLSKSIWVGVILAIAPLIPGVSGLIASHPDAVVSAVGIIGIILRFVTKDKISLQ